METQLSLRRKWTYILSILCYSTLLGSARLNLAQDIPLPPPIHSGSATLLPPGPVLPLPPAGVPSTAAPKLPMPIPAPAPLPGPLLPIPTETNQAPLLPPDSEVMPFPLPTVKDSAADLGVPVPLPEGSWQPIPTPTAVEEMDSSTQLKIRMIQHLSHLDLRLYPDIQETLAISLQDPQAIVRRAALVVLQEKCCGERCSDHQQFIECTCACCRARERLLPRLRHYLLVLSATGDLAENQPDNRDLALDMLIALLQQQNPTPMLLVPIPTVPMDSAPNRPAYPNPLPLANSNVDPQKTPDSADTNTTTTAAKPEQNTNPPREGIRRFIPKIFRRKDR